MAHSVEIQLKIIVLCVFLIEARRASIESERVFLKKKENKNSLHLSGSVDVGSEGWCFEQARKATKIKRQMTMARSGSIQKIKGIHIIVVSDAGDAGAIGE